MNAGDTKDIHATFPADYGAPDLAGKDATFTITVHEVKEAELPAIDDEFAKRVSQHDTLDALQEELRGRLNGVAAQKARRQISTPSAREAPRGQRVPVARRSWSSARSTACWTNRGSTSREPGISWDDYLKKAAKPRTNSGRASARKPSAA